MSVSEQSLVLQDPPGGLRELVRVSLPLVISAGSHSVMSVADRIMLAGYTPAGPNGAEQTLDILAAVTPAAMLHWTVACIPLGTIFYANTFISQFDGAKRPGRMIASLWHAIWIAIAAGLLLGLLAPFSEGLFRAVGHTPQVAQQEAAYFNILCVGSVLLLVPSALSCFFSGRRHTAVVMWVNVASVVLNVAIGYCLIFGRLGLPELGIRGAAYATLLARCFDTVIYVALMIQAARRGRFPFRQTLAIRTRILRRYLKFGLPSGLHYFVDNSSFLLFLFIVGNLNRDAMAATNLAFSINSLIFVPLLGFGTAVQTLVGHHIGAGLRPAAGRTTRNAAWLGIFWTGLAAILLLVFPNQSLQLFLLLSESGSSEPSPLQAVLPVAAQLLSFVAIYSVFDSLAVVFASALRGAGDTLFPMIITMASSWGVMTIPAWLLVRFEHATINLLWMTCTAHITFMGSVMFLRFLTGRWKTIDLIES